LSALLFVFGVMSELYDLVLSSAEYSQFEKSVI